jgi:hypothetical protein
MMQVQDIHRVVEASRKYFGLPPRDSCRFSARSVRRNGAGQIRIDHGSVMPLRACSATARFSRLT